MNKLLKITFWVSVIAAVFWLAWFVWVFFGNPYLRVHLLGTQYLEDTNELYVLSQEKNEPYYLIKKYKYSKETQLIGFGGGSIRIDDYYGLGIADKNKKEILPPKYEFLYAKQDFKTKEIYIHAVPHRKTGHEPDEYYILENNKIVVISRKY